MADEYTLYALAVGARTIGSVYYMPATCWARSKAEATGIGIEAALNAWPQAEGWGDHGATAMQVLLPDGSPIVRPPDA